MTAPKRGAALTDREVQVLRAFADGNNYGDVGKLLKLSEFTVKSHAERIYVKLGARDKTHAVALAFHGGLLKPDPKAKPALPPVPTLHSYTVPVSVDLLSEMLAVVLATAEGRVGPSVRQQAGRVLSAARALKVREQAARSKQGRAA